MSVRVYVPLTSTRLGELLATRRLEGPLAAHAVTGHLRAEWPEGDEDDWEYAAMTAAADASWTLRRDGDAPRRIVLAADVGQVSADPTDATTVEVPDGVGWSSVAALHVDTEDYHGDEDRDLAWYATQEIVDVAGTLG